MAVGLLDYNAISGYYEFTYDDWTTDADKLPRIGISGKDGLSTVKGCRQGAMAIGTDGTIKILKGDTNEWIDY